MARNQAPSSSPVTAQPPEGFRRSGSANAVGWFNLGKIGNVLQGTLLGMYQRKDKLRQEGTSNFFQVQIVVPCEVRVDRGEDASMQEAPAGSIVNVNYGPKTRGWENLVGDIKRGAVYEVYGVIAGAKVKLDGGRTMHNFDVFEKCTRAPEESAESDVDFQGSSEENF